MLETPEAGPVGIDGELGALFGTVMVTDNVFDHPEVAPILSVAIALTRYVPAALHA